MESRELQWMRYISWFACNGDLQEIESALYQIILQCFDCIEAGVCFLDRIESWIDEVGVNDFSNNTYLCAECLNNETVVSCDGGYEAFVINYENLICEMAHAFDIEPINLLNSIRSDLKNDLAESKTTD